MKYSKEFRTLTRRSIILIILFVGIQLILSGIIAKTQLPSEIKPFGMDDLALATIFIVVIILAINKEKIIRVKEYKINKWERIISIIGMIITFIIYFQYKKYLISNVDYVKNYLYVFTTIEYTILFLALFLLITMIYGIRMIINVYKNYKKEIIIIILGTIILYLVIKEFQKLWPYFSGIVGISVKWLLDLISPTTFYYLGEIPVLHFEGFAIGIAETCSGIASILLFTALYIAGLAWDWKIINKKKALLLYLPAVIGAFALNIIRIFMMMIIGAYISESFAINAFHTNASLILFLIYYTLFWKISYKWMIKK